MDVTEAKEAFSEWIDTLGFDALYDPKAQELAAQLMEDPTVWNPVKHWLKAEAKKSDDCSAAFIDDWVKTLYQLPALAGESDLFFEIGDHVEIAKEAARVVEKAGEVIFDMGQFYQYRNAGVWERVREQDISRVISRFSGAPVASHKASTGPAKLKVSSGMIDGVIRVYRDHVDKSGDEARPGFFAEAPGGIMYSDRFLRVDMASKKVVMEDPSPVHRQTVGAGCSFDGASDTPIFDAYMESVFRDDPDAEAKTRLLLEFIAASLAGIATSYQQAVILYDATDRSTGANGKSVLVKIINEIFPSAAVSSVSPSEFGERFTRAMLAGKRINFVTEMPDEHGIISGETTKAIITGEPIKAEEKNQKPFFFSPIAGHIFACNDFPSVSDNSDAFWRRWIVVPFNRTFTAREADPQLVRKIVSQESSQLLRRLGLALDDLVRRGHYQIPQECADAFAVWKRQSCSVLSFLIEQSADYNERGYVGNVDPDACHWTYATELYEGYKGFCSFWNLRPVGANTFGRRAKKLLEHKRDPKGVKYRVRIVENAIKEEPWKKKDRF